MLQTSSSQDRAHRSLVELHPKRIDFVASDVTSIQQTAINVVNQAIDSAVQTVTKVIQRITEGTITSDIDALEVIDNHRYVFGNSTHLPDACALAEEAQKRTDEYVNNVRELYSQFMDTIIPDITHIQHDLDQFKRNPTNEVADDADASRMHKLKTDAQTFATLVDVNVQSDLDVLQEDVQTMAQVVEIGYQDISLKLNALLKVWPTHIWKNSLFLFSKKIMKTKIKFEQKKNGSNIQLFSFSFDIAVPCVCVWQCVRHR